MTQWSLMRAYFAHLPSDVMLNYILRSVLYSLIAVILDEGRVSAHTFEKGLAKDPPCYV